MPSHPFYLLRRVKHQFGRFLSLSLISALCLILTVSACSSPTSTSSSADPAELRIGFQVVPNPELLAKAMGLIEKNLPNTRIQWSRFESGRDVNTAMAAKGIDLGESGSVPTSIGIAQGLPYQVYFIQFLIGDNEALVVRNNQGIDALAGIKGKKFGVTFGSTTHFSFLSALKQEGIKETELTILDMQPPDMLAAWQRGDIDGGFVWQPTLGKMVESGGKVLITAKMLADKGVVTADLALVHKDFLGQYPQVLTKYVTAMNEAIQFYRDNPQEAAKRVAPEVGLSPEETLKVMNEMVWLSPAEQMESKYLGTPEQPGALANVLRDTADFMVSQKIIRSSPDLATYQQAINSQAISQVSKAG